MSPVPGFKKLTTVSAVCLLALTLTACGGGGGGSESTTRSASNEASAQLMDEPQAVLSATSVSSESDTYLRSVNMLAQNAAHSGTLVDHFDASGVNTGSVPGWFYERGAEFPGSGGSLNLTGGAWNTVAAASLNADLNCGSTAIELSQIGTCGRYVAMTRRLPTLLVVTNSDTAMLQMRIRTSHPLLTGTLRVVDASGQTLQFRLPAHTPESAAGSEWATVAVSLARPMNHWGGANDGRIRNGITTISVLANVPTLTAPAGSIAVDDIRLMDNGVVDYGLSRQAPLAATGVIPTLQGRATVSSRFNHMSDAALKQAADAGFTNVRLDIFWQMVESRGRFDFATFDAILTRMAKYGLSAHFILAYGHPEYGTGAPTSATARAGFLEYARRVTAFAKGRNVSALEVWNEPDNTNFWSGGDPVAYADLLGATRAAIQSVDPARKVVNGGPSWVNLPYILRLAKTGQLAGLSGFAIHPYRTAAPETFGVDALAMKAVLASQGANLPIWGTEWGLSSAGRFDTALFGNGHDTRARERQAVLVLRNYLAQIGQNLPVLTLYELADSGTDPNHPEHNYGLLSGSMTPKPAYTAIRTFNGFVASRRYAGMLANAPANVHAMRWDSASDAVYTVWVSSVRTTLNLHVPPGATVRNWKGSVVALTSTTNGTQKLTLNEVDGPVFVVVPHTVSAQ